MTFSKIKQYCVLLLASSAVLFTSCKEDKIKSLTELKKEQATAIKTLINRKSIRVVEAQDNVLPDPIDPNVYYKFSNGLYMRVLDRGLVGKEGYKAVINETKVFVEFKGYTFTQAKREISQFDILGDPSYPPVEFLYTYAYQYGETHYTPLPQTSPVANLDHFMCQGLAYPMSLLGNGARVSLIIPFELGPSTFYASGISTFVEEAQYRFR